MRAVQIDRRLLGDEPLLVPGSSTVPTAYAHQVFDERGLPDGFPFIVDDDGTTTGCSHLNQYLVDAWEQRAFDLGNMARFHVYHLGRLLRFIRRTRAEQSAADSGKTVTEWLRQNGEPKVDLTFATRADLIAYRDSRKNVVESTTLDTEIGCISSFFRYAVEKDWIDTDPVSRWRGRNTLMSGNRRVRQARFLTAAQTSYFLAVGLRGDGSPADTRPSFPERDYSYGLLLATTGLRREEGALLLDNEIPSPSAMPPGGVHVFNRTGKKNVTRAIYVTAEAAQAVDLYRQTERVAIAQRHQRRLRAQRREGRLLIVGEPGVLRGQPAITVNGHLRPTTALSDEDRARAVRVLDDGTLEPAGLFLGRGLPPVLAYWNHLFSDARDRVHEAGGPDRPPEHVTVAPHTMRHTFAVRMLAALMREGRERAGDPYMLLANPLLTVKELLGHADVATTQDYLFAAETWKEDVPSTLRDIAAGLVGHIRNDGLDPIIEDEDGT